MKDQALLQETIAEANEADRHGDASTEKDSDRRRKEVFGQASPSQEGSQHDTDITSSLSQFGLESSSTSESDTSDTLQMKEYENSDNQSKEDTLIAMFPKITTFSVKHTLKKCKFNFADAVEDLLNQNYVIEEEEITGKVLVAKGVDGFEASTVSTKRRKGKNKSRQGQQVSSSTPSTEQYIEGPALTTSRWELAQEDINFILSRTCLPKTAITSAYYKNGASIAGALNALLDADASNTAHVSNYEECEYLGEVLIAEVPKLNLTQATTLIRLTALSFANARELALKLSATPAPGPGVKIIGKYAPIKITDNTSSVNVPRTLGDLDLGVASKLAASNLAARNHLYAKAAASAKKANSTNNMGGVAAYYSNEARKHDKLARAFNASAADALVESQSNKYQLDLHGVSVKDAVRISRERVTAWWSYLGETRSTGNFGEGSVFRIITGVGNHSEGGRGKIGPAVGKMLFREGWKVEHGSGRLVVVGVMKKR